MANLLGTSNHNPAISISERPRSGPLRDGSEPGSAGTGGRTEPGVKIVHVPTGLEIIPHSVAAPSATASQPHSVRSNTKQEWCRSGGEHTADGPQMTEDDKEGLVTVYLLLSPPVSQGRDALSDVCRF